MELTELTSVVFTTCVGDYNRMAMYCSCGLILYCSWSAITCMFQLWYFYLKAVSFVQECKSYDAYVRVTMVISICTYHISYCEFKKLVAGAKTREFSWRVTNHTIE